VCVCVYVCAGDLVFRHGVWPAQVPPYTHV
jgi:hypothetical protein